MKKIGAGLQFNVYDLGNGKVLKVPRSEREMYLKYLSWCPYYLFVPWKLTRLVKIAIKDRRHSINKLKKESYDKTLFGNLVFKDNRIIQDKVKPLKYFLNNKSFKEILNKYFEFILECWKQGFSDKIYNLDTNNGIDKTGKIVLMDIGELNFDKEDVMKDIISKRWERSFFYKRRLKKHFRKYYDVQARKLLTIENLNKYWKTT